MRYLEMNSGDVYTNLATEEYVFRNYRDDTYFLLWGNDSSIVVGKNQNVFQEIDIRAAERTGTKIARRITGGGTVFHDAGNLNYSILMEHNEETFSYDQCLAPVIRALVRMGVSAHKRRTSDIAIDGKKISGSAQTISRGRLLHHGTLLYDADLQRLKLLLRPGSGTFESGATLSVPSEVVNIKDCMPTPLSIEEFRKQFLKNVVGQDVSPLILTGTDWAAIRKLRDEKYANWDWNFGSSPAFTWKKEKNGSFIELCVEKGRIQMCRIDEQDRTGELKNVRYSAWDVILALRNSGKSCREIETIMDQLF